MVMQPIEFEVNLNINPQIMSLINEDNDLKLLLNSFTQVLQGIASNISHTGLQPNTASNVLYREEITEMGLSKRSQHALLQSGVAYVDQLKEYTVDELLAIKGVGNNAITIIQDNVVLISERLEQQSEYSKIGFPTRLENLLKKKGYNSPEELKNESPERIKAIEGLGKTSKVKILDFLGVKDLPDSRNRVSVNRLGFDTKVVNALVNAGINTERQLISSDPDKLRKLKGIGPQSHILLKNYIQDAKVEIKGLDVRDLNFSSRARTILAKNGVYSIEQLKNMSFNQIEKMNGVGQGIMHEIINVLEHGNANPKDKDKIINSEQKEMPTKLENKISIVKDEVKVDIFKDETKVDIIKDAVKVDIVKDETKVDIIKDEVKVDIVKDEVKALPNKIIKKHTLNILELPIRTVHILEKHNIRCVEDLQSKTNKDIVTFSGITKDSAAIIHDSLEKYKSISDDKKNEHAHYFLKDIGIEKRVHDILSNSNIHFIDEVTSLTDLELLKINGIGKPSIKALKKEIQKFKNQ
jgi:DNA-directed RNA polymerase alpha subunit